MVDFHSRYKLYSYGYTTPEVREAVSKRHHEHEVSRQLYRHRGERPVHDCRPEVVKEFYDPKDWETQIIAKGLNESFNKSVQLHIPSKREANDKKSSDKKLFETGTYGTGKECFNYPRGLLTSFKTCDVIVVDTRNHRIKMFTNCGVFRFMFGRKGEKSGQFNEPTGICELPCGDFAVADSGNQRVQVFSPNWKFKFMFPTVNTPYGIGCSTDSKIIVSTVTRKIEVYNSDGVHEHMFSIDGPSLKADSPLPICINDINQIIVCDPVDSMIKFYSIRGCLLFKFEPKCPGIGRSVVPCGICLSLENLVVADSLNHTVNLYTDKGEFLEQILGPTDDAGMISALSCGPEGHLVTTEFSVTGQHCLKIFKYLDCKCHGGRPLSSKRTSIVPKSFEDLSIVPVMSSNRSSSV